MSIVKFDNNLKAELEKLDVNEQTRKTYNRMIGTIRLDNPSIRSVKVSTFLTKYDVISRYINEMNASIGTKRNYAQALYSLAMNSDINLSLKKKYTIFSKKLMDETAISRSNNTANEDKMIPYDEYQSLPGKQASIMIDKYKRVFASTRLIDDDKRYEYLNDLTKYMTLALYCYQAPIRTEWSSVELDGSNGNSYDEETGVAKFSKFKNVNSMGSVQIELRSEVKSIIDQYLKTLRSFARKLNFKVEYLLYDVRPNKKIIQPFNPNYFSQFVKNLLFDLTGKKLTINSLRHIYETHFINSDEYMTLTNAEKDAKHRELLHRTETANREYYKV